jgi:pumilio RNA-binding family
MAKDFDMIVVNQYGTRVLQKLVETMYKDSQHKKLAFILLKEMEGSLLYLFKNQNAIYLIPKIIKLVPHSNDFVYDCLAKNIVQIAADKNGCCGLQKCLEVANPLQYNTIITLILGNLLLFMTDQYANYVLQFIVSQNNQLLLRRLIMCFKNNITFLAKQKYSSNVIEKVMFY